VGAEDPPVEVVRAVTLPQLEIHQVPLRSPGDVVAVGLAQGFNGEVDRPAESEVAKEF